MLTEKQKQILNFIGNDVKTTAEIVAELGGKYHCNGRHLVGQRLSRMVKAGILVRVKKGVFKRSERGVTRFKSQHVVAANQINLF